MSRYRTYPKRDELIDKILAKAKELGLEPPPADTDLHSWTVAELILSLWIPLQLHEMQLKEVPHA